MKKKILFAVIALVTLLAFTGCDKILEFMFPDSTGGGDGGWGENSIQVQISVADPDVEWWNYTIWVELSIQNDDGTFSPVGEAYRSGPASVPFDQPDATPAAAFRYDGLANGVYSVKAWMDVNAAWGPDAEDLQAIGHTDTGATQFDLPFTLFDGSTTKELWVFGELFKPIDVGSGTPFLFVKDGLVQDMNYDTWYFNVDTTVETTYFEEIYFDIYDLNGYWIYGDVAYGNTITAYVGYYWTPGPYTLSIWSATASDGTSIDPWQWNVQFQVVDGYSADGWYAGSDIVNYSLGGSPWNLYENVTSVVADFYDSYGGYIGQYTPGYTYYGGFEFWYSSNTPSIYVNFGNAGRVRLVVDVDDDGFYSSDDLMAEVPLWADASWTWNDGYEYRPYFNVDAYRFIPYNDFVRIYGY